MVMVITQIYAYVKIPRAEQSPKPIFLCVNQKKNLLIKCKGGKKSGQEILTCLYNQEILKSKERELLEIFYCNLVI